MIKTTVAVILIILGGVIGGGLFFGDILLDNRTLFYLMVAVYYLVAGGLIGFLSLPAWPRAVIVSWSVFAIFFLNFQTSIQEGSLISNILMVFVPVISSLLGGYLIKSLLLYSTE
ncbi:MAG: hypothetical protein G01um10147_229 [Microgenomates group bacterium Gr01-1014_7]|nr:MAG: hypothetical protein G01um10147_229 [Microgenomates group bacterium Gr01-1014_7]